MYNNYLIYLYFNAVALWTSSFELTPFPLVHFSPLLAYPSPGERLLWMVPCDELADDFFCCKKCIHHT